MEVNNLLFPQQFVSFWLYLYSEIKGPQITLLLSHLWKWGLTQLSRFSLGFLAHGGESLPSRHLYGTVKWKTILIVHLKGAGHSLHMGMPLFLAHEITAVAFFLKLRQERPNKKISHPFVTNYSSLAHFDAFKIKEERKQELKLGIFKL